MEVDLSRWESHKILFEHFALLRVCNYCQFLPKDTLKGPTILVRLLVSAILQRGSCIWDSQRRQSSNSSLREALSKPNTGRHRRSHQKSQHTSHFQQQQSPGKNALTSQHAAGGFAYLSFQIVTSTQTGITNQVTEPDRLGGCEHTLGDGGNGWGMRWKFHGGVCGRKALETAFEKYWEVSGVQQENG